MTKDDLHILIGRALKILDHDLPDSNAAIVSKIAAADLELVRELAKHYGEDLQGGKDSRPFVEEIRELCRPQVQTKILSLRAAHLLDTLPDRDDALVAKIVLRDPTLHAEVVEKFGKGLLREFGGRRFPELVRGYWMQLHQSFLDFDLVELGEGIGQDALDRRLYLAKRGGEYILEDLLVPKIGEDGTRLLARIRKQDSRLYSEIVKEFGDDLMAQFPPMAARAFLIYHKELDQDQNFQINHLFSYVRGMKEKLGRMPRAWEVARELTAEQPEALVESLEEEACPDLYTLCLALLRHFEEPAMYQELRDMGEENPAQAWTRMEDTGHGGRGK